MHFANLSKSVLMSFFYRDGQVLQRSNPRGCHLDALSYIFFLSLFVILDIYLHIDHYADGFWNLRSALLYNAWCCLVLRNIKCWLRGEVNDELILRRK